jgi:2-polyprenyl-6-methoxyphenol hydroxylase-like FAD-dependent oxidoreductase
MPEMSGPGAQVLVVGAGPTGLLLAAELERRDVPCLLIGVGGFEPPISAPQKLRDTRLRYTPFKASSLASCPARPKDR